MSKDLKEYFNRMPRLGALATAGKDGKVDVAYFGSAQMIDEKDAVQMVQLMLKGAGEQSAALDGELLSIDIDPLHHHFLCPLDDLVEAGYAQAPLFTGVLSIETHDNGVHDDERIALLFRASLESYYAERPADLVRRQPDAPGSTHGLFHVGGQVAYLVRDVLHLIGDASEHFVRIRSYWMDHGPILYDDGLL